MKKISILIVDDNQIKLEKVISIVQKNKYFPSIEYVPVLDIIQAKKALEEKNYDLMILDIQLPNRLGEPVHKDGGIRLLQSLKSSISSKMYTPSHIVGITEYEEALIDYSKKFQESLLTIVSYDETSDSWEKQLNNKMEQVVESAQGFEAVESSAYNVDVAIICALYEPELQSILDLNGDWKELPLESDDVTTYYTGVLYQNGQPIKVIAAQSSQMGMPAAGIVATKMINEFKPKYLFMTGITAGVEGKTRLGDVIIADSCWDYSNVKKVTDGSLPDYKPLRLDSDLNNIATKLSRNTSLLSRLKADWRGAKPEHDLKIHVGDLASGGAVVADDQVVLELQSHARKLLGIEMEAYGVMLAANLSKNPKPKVMVMKSVCDFANSEKSDDYQAYASYTSAGVFEYIVTNNLRL